MCYKGGMPKRKLAVQADSEALESRRRDLVIEISRLREQLEIGDVDPSEDEADPDVFQREKTLALIANLERELEQIDAAMQVAASGNYGICQRCGQAIDPERLKVLPEATLCVRCKAETEGRRAVRAFQDDDWD
jgi:DnaK suppressor protein